LNEFQLKQNNDKNDRQKYFSTTQAPVVNEKEKKISNNENNTIKKVQNIIRRDQCVTKKEKKWTQTNSI